MRSLRAGLAVTLLVSLLGCPEPAAEDDAGSAGRDASAVADGGPGQDAAVGVDAVQADSAAASDSATTADAATVPDRATADDSAAAGDGATAPDRGVDDGDLVPDVQLPDTFSCPPGYEVQAGACVDIDGCADEPCFPGVACDDVPAPDEGFTCGDCPTGYEGDGEVCTDVDECRQQLAGCDPLVGVCTNLPASFACACPPGYSDDLSDGTQCTDYDECSGEGDGNTCSGGCVNHPGYYDCAGDLLVCRRSGGGEYTSGGDITDCFEDYSCNGEERPREVWCELQADDSYSCDCKIAYITESTFDHPAPCGQLTADNINLWCGWAMRASSKELDLCRAGLLQCGELAECREQFADSVCLCPEGTAGDPALYGAGCEDIDECATDNGGCGDPSYWRCVNNEGAAPTCEDIDECAIDNGSCGDPAYWTCIDNEGAAPTCEDIDECAVDNGSCGDPTYWTCIDNDGAPPTCQDLDECAVDNGGCGHPMFYMCTNNEGAPPTCGPIDCRQVEQDFYEPGLFSFEVPDDVTELHVKAWGAGGGGVDNAPWSGVYPGGSGGYVEATLPVTPGTSMFAVVGMGGNQASCGGGTSGAGGGGHTTLVLADFTPLISAGGGGGAADGGAGCAVAGVCSGSPVGTPGAGFGAGGSASDATATDGDPGTGPPDFYGGAPGDGACDLPEGAGGYGGGGGGGGTHNGFGGGGGGGGYPGGGGGDHAGGHGGSNYVDPAATTIQSGSGGSAGGAAGVNGDNGRLTISCS